MIGKRERTRRSPGGGSASIASEESNRGRAAVGGGIALDEYAAMKLAFETTHAYVKSSNMIIEMDPVTKVIRMYTLEHATEYFSAQWSFVMGPGPMDSVPFLPMWRRDTERRIVDGTSHDPDDNTKFYQPIVLAYELFEARARSDIQILDEHDLREKFNKMGLSWAYPTGNELDDVPVDSERVLSVFTSKEAKIMELFMTLMRAVAGPTGSSTHEYVMDYLAHMVQRPTENPGVALVITGGKGIGKDTFVNFVLTYIVGVAFSHVYTTAKQFWGEHDFFRVGKLAVCWQEPDTKSLRSNAAELRALITAHVINANPKGKDAFVCDNIVRYFFTSNDANPTGLQSDGDVERRFLLLNMTNELKGKHEEFFTPAYEHLMKPIGGYVIGNFLRARDISQRIIFRLPQSDHMAHLIEQSLPEVDRFVSWWAKREAVEEDPDERAAAEVYTLFKEGFNNVVAVDDDNALCLTKHQFAAQLGVAVNAGHVLKRVGGGHTAFYRLRR
jgi:hypothetical protein